MENTTENKAKFFALYWGQRVVYDNNRYYTVDTLGITILRGCLLLTPLSQITDEDAKELGKICGLANGTVRGYAYSVLVEDDSYQLQISFNGYICLRKNDKLYNEKGILDCYDFVRSKGYALPYMGLSVEDLVKLGWIRLV